MVFSKTAAVINQVKAVTTHVREVAAGRGAGGEGAEGDDEMARKEAEGKKSAARNEEAADPAVLAIAREATAALVKEKTKLKEEMEAMKLLLSQMEGPPTPPGVVTAALGDTAHLGADPYLSEDMLLAEENVDYVSARPFSYIPGLEDLELSVPVARAGDKSAAPAPASHKRLENMAPNDEESQYQGALRGGRPHGKGSWVDPATGDKYDGEWLDGLFHGQAHILKSPRYSGFVG